ncbi:MAG: isochorismatase family protein [Planctomycetes bacterium]|nr:isochorismatase family protein [Planctomycetota bacterium]
MNRSHLVGFALGALVALGAVFAIAPAPHAVSAAPDAPPPAKAEPRTYDNTLTPIQNPKPLLADFPQFVEPVIESKRFEAARLVDDANGDLDVRAWRWSYNARGIVEMPNRLRARDTAVIMVHPWAVDDEWGWKTPEPAGVVDFCTPEKNALAAQQTKEVIDPFLKRLRGKAAFVMYSLPGPADAIRTKVYRSFAKTPTADERAAGTQELRKALAAYSYKGQPLPAKLTLSADKPVSDYFRQFPGLDAGPRYNGDGFWKLPIPVSTAVTVDPADVVIYDAEGYGPLRDFLKKNGVRHVLLTGYATDMCFCKTTAGYENLSKDFNVFLVGDATLATFPANSTPRFATNAHISFAALNQLVTQVNWVKMAE